MSFHLGDKFTFCNEWNEIEKTYYFATSPIVGQILKIIRDRIYLMNFVL